MSTNLSRLRAANEREKTWLLQIAVLCQPPVIQVKTNPTCTAATAGAAWPCGHPLQCPHLWSSGWRPLLQLRSCAHERRVNEVPGSMQRAPRVTRKAEQVLLSFLGF